MSHDHDDRIDIPTLAAANEGCEESRLLMNRRSLMGLSAGFFASGIIPRSALAAETDKRLLIVVLRGGMDGLHVVIPHRDDTYLRFRRQFLNEITKPGIPRVVLNNYSSHILHPELTNFGAMFNAGEAAIIHGIAPPFQKRSHFQCQYNLESGHGEENPNVPDGWLNRMLHKMQAVDSVNPYGALAVGPTPFILTGQAKVLSWSAEGQNSGFPGQALTALTDYYTAFDQAPGRFLASGLATNAMAKGVKSGSAESGKVRAAFQGAARLMSADDGPRIGVLSIDGWDTHISETASYGIGSRLSLLDDGLHDFKVLMGKFWSNTVVACVSEFGRTLELNKTGSTAGTEHGIGTVALLAGGAVRGGFYGELPDLRAIAARKVEDPILQGRYDLDAPVDTRQLFKAILYDHLQLEPRIYESAVFPDSAHRVKLPGMFTSSPVPAPGQAVRSTSVKQ